MCCGQETIRPNQQPSQPRQAAPVINLVKQTAIQVNAVNMDDSINSRRAAEALQANHHAKNFGNG